MREGAGLLCLLVAAGVAHATPPPLREALEKYDYGEFDAACERLSELRGAPDFDVEARLKTLKYLGACRHVLGDEAGARSVWLDLLHIDPAARLDPVQFPPEMVTYFAEVRAADQERRAAQAETRPPERRPVKPAEKPPRDEAVRDTARKPSMARAIAPFGLGQFQNGHRSKGIVLAALQGTALAVGVGGLVAFESNKESGTFLGGGEFRDPRYAETLQTVYLAGFGAFAALWIYGAIDGVAYLGDAPVALLPAPGGFVLGGRF